MKNQNKKGRFHFYFKLLSFCWVELKTMTPEKIKSGVTLILSYFAFRRQQNKQKALK